jgi:hypothetical protein
MAPANITSITHLLEKLALLGNYAASGGNFLPTFQDTLLVPSSGFKTARYGVPKCWQEITTIHCIITQKSTVGIYFMAEA